MNEQSNMKDGRQFEQFIGSLSAEQGLLFESEKVPIIYYDEPGMLERPSKLFGRQEALGQLQALLNDGQQVLLVGMAGIGKTALAAAAADGLLTTSQRPVIWVRVGGEGFAAVLDALLGRLSFDPEQQSKRPVSETAKFSTLQNLLEQLLPALLVLDDVRGGNALRILEAVPDHTAVIVTARQRYFMANILDVGGLPPQDALDLLGYHANLEDIRQDRDAGRLCAMLAYHPLALEIAGTALQVDERLPGHLLAALQNSPHELAMPYGVGDAGQMGIRDLLDSSFNELSGPEKEVFLTFGLLFSPSATPILLNQFLSMDQAAMSRALCGLQQRGLVKRQEPKDGDVEIYQVHGLTFSFVRARVESERGIDDAARVSGIMQYLANHGHAFDYLKMDMPNILGAVKQTGARLQMTAVLGEKAKAPAVQLFETLQGKLSLSELKALCFLLQVEYDDLPGEGLTARLRELVLYHQRRDSLPRLIATVREQRPDIAL